ncbi:hypothetical protein CBER1_09284 [Cercospora berteroae]|uniref:Heme oxygenase-like protein n=1 Tax=Cercospora berteroae TaxID=357750 RepID=A0A2S6CFE3_9PEZI|nr:hypothetical protein CBER1_09284 [Cercospora berteroae]
MPRPPDNYTHAQFEPVESEHQGETVQCIHCRNWTGSVKTLNRKKAHLLNCTQYAQWRAAGNGQDLAPPNKYNKRDSDIAGWHAVDGDAAHGYHSSPYGPQQFATPVARTRGLDTTKVTSSVVTDAHRSQADNSNQQYFDEFWDDTSGQKCMRVRCKSCGFVRAKNTTRQVEHLALCQDFLNSPEGQRAVDTGELELAPSAPGPTSYNNSASGADIWRGSRPNPNLLVGSRPSNGAVNHMRPPQRPNPSLVNHLLNKWPEKFTKATQLQFLSHAGCGTLSTPALSHWLGQNGHISRAMIAFIGNLIGKVRLPDVPDSKQSTQFRALDLLISTVSNLRKEIDFIENTKRKYGIHTDNEPPLPITKAYVDLLTSSAESRSSLLEGMVALWATEHCYCASWQYASTFASNVPASNYSVPSYLTGSGVNYGGEPTPFRGNVGAGNNDQHTSALQEALIPNWTSREFAKFVEACRAIVDELANAETTGSGREQLLRCEGVFQQVVFLWERIWPEVNGMGEEDGIGDGTPAESPANQLRPQSSSHGAGPAGNNGTAEKSKSEPIEIEDDDDENGHSDAPMDNVDSPFGGTGLGAVAAANQGA